MSARDPKQNREASFLETQATPPQTHIQTQNTSFFMGLKSLNITLNNKHQKLKRAHISTETNSIRTLKDKNHYKVKISNMCGVCVGVRAGFTREGRQAREREQE